jgi:uncharacterized protein (TIGR01777 family)
MDTVLITGGTGMIGSALTSLLTSRGYKVIVLSRTKRDSHNNISYALWDVRKSFIDPAAIAEADHIVHLGGAGIADKRWTRKRKAEILSSRVNGSRLIVKALRENDNHVKTVVSASAIGWYGPDRNHGKGFVETDRNHSDFLGETSRQWEESISGVRSLGKRLVIIRTGIVLANDGGAFPEFVKPMKAGIAPILGSGQQIISWIHIDDLCRLYLWAIEMTDLEGVYNGTAPGPVSNRELMLKIARARKRPFIAIHVPSLVLKLMLGEMSIEVLKSANVDSSKIRNSGFTFTFPTIDSAVNHLVR